VVRATELQALQNVVRIGHEVPVSKE
jgi:hypothetical protein